MDKALRRVGSGLIGVLHKADLELYPLLHARLQGRVPHGPFAGMLAPDAISWGSACAKLLGAYESCLHGVLAALPEAGIDGVMDIGCAEGYYAVGLARLLPSVTVHAHDVMKEAQTICRRLAERNGVHDRVVVGGLVDHALLEAWLRQCRRPLLMVDIEGAELDLLDPVLVPALRHALVLVELHEFRHRGLAATFEARFAATHRIESILETDRAATDFPGIAGLPATLRSVALCELRPERMRWLWMEPGGRG
jgi:hypothetical protein